MPAFPLHLSPQKRAFLTGTLLLTGTGFLCRILGFFYRIFLSRAIGAQGLGIYNMVHPVFSICFALCAGSMQTALSQYVAANQRKGKSALRTGLILSLSLSFLLTAFICCFSSPIAKYLLLEPDCGPYVFLIALSVPFSALHACINGLYYGMQKSRIPAFSQVAEQILRMTAVFFMVCSLEKQGLSLNVSLAVYGHLIGEAASATFTAVCMVLWPPVSRQNSSDFTPKDFRTMAFSLSKLSLPLMGNRLILNLLGSAEAIWIPNRLTAFGLETADAFAVYGVLTGMALPFIMFPSAITNSMAVLLLPAVAQSQAEGNQRRISSAVSMALRYSLYMGILCTGIFCLYGRELGTSVFENPSAGAYIRVLGWLCPFMYLATTLGSILNGLGKTSSTFLQNVCAMCIRLLFVLMGIPRLGIKAYLIGILASEIFLSCWHLITLKKLVNFHWNAADIIAKPVLLLLTGSWINRKLWGILSSVIHPVLLNPGTPLSFMGTALQIGTLCMFYGVLLGLWHLFISEENSSAAFWGSPKHFT